MRHGRGPSGVHWSHPYDDCPHCGFDLDQYACTQAIADADASDAREAPDLPVHRRVVFYWWPQTLTACPHCRQPLAYPELAWG